MTEGAIDHEDADARSAEYARCTDFTTEHGLDASGDRDVFGAAICPTCGKHNALTGTPADFREQVVRCMKCTRVMVLDATALVTFAEGIADA